MSYLLFVGAFNPPTKAHIELAEYACEKTGAKKVIFMPSKMSYIEYDQAKNFAFLDTERLAMLESICATHPKLMVSDYELKSTTYISNTLLLEGAGICMQVIVWL